jgi:hypothetical protein
VIPQDGKISRAIINGEETRKNQNRWQGIKQAHMVEAVAKPDELHVRRRQQHRRLPSWAPALRRRERQPELLVPLHGPRPHPGRRRAQERQQPARGGREVHGEGRGALLPAVARGGGHGRGGGGGLYRKRSPFLSCSRCCSPEWDLLSADGRMRTSAAYCGVVGGQKATRSRRRSALQRPAGRPRSMMDG